MLLNTLFDVWKGCFIHIGGYMQIKEGQSQVSGVESIWAESWKIWKHKLGEKRQTFFWKRDMFNTPGVCKEESSRRWEGGKSQDRWETHLDKQNLHKPTWNQCVFCFPYFLSSLKQIYFMGGIPVPSGKWLAFTDGVLT